MDTANIIGKAIEGAMEKINTQLKDLTEENTRLLTSQYTLSRDNALLKEKVTRLEKENRELRKKATEVSPSVYSIGQRFRRVGLGGVVDPTEFLLVQVSMNRVTLISTKDGVRWIDADLYVANVRRIPVSDFDAKFVGPQAKEWKVVG